MTHIVNITALIIESQNMEDFFTGNKKTLHLGVYLPLGELK